MRGILQSTLCILVACLFAGCDTTSSAERKSEAQRKAEEAARLRAAYLVRIHEAESDVWKTLDPLIQKAADYKEKETFGYIGAVFVSELFYGDAFIREARAEGFGPFVSVLSVMPGSPADVAGVKAGDRLVSINGVKAPGGEAAAFFAAKKVKRLLKPGEPNQLELLRNGETVVVDVEPVKGAYYGVVVVPDDSVDLYVDGDVIWISLSLVESLRKRDDLHYICAYALAKNVMRQPKQKGKNALLGQVLDVAAMASGVNTGGLFGNMGSKAYQNAFDVEADLIALYLLASADYEFAGYPDFWERSLISSSRKGKLKPKDEERLEADRKVIASIQAKQAAGEPIFPVEYLSGDVSEIE